MATQKKNDVKEPKGWLSLDGGRSARTGEVIIAYPRLFEINPNDEYNPDKYAANIVITEEEWKWLRSVVALNAYNYGVKYYKKWDGKAPAKVEISEAKELTEEQVAAFFPGGANKTTYYMLSLKTPQKPQVVDANKEPLENPREVYSGMRGRLTLRAYPWKFQNRSGISFALGGVVQKTGEGVRVGGSQVDDTNVFEEVSPADPFAQAESKDDDLTMPMKEEKQGNVTSDFPF